MEVYFAAGGFVFFALLVAAIKSRKKRGGMPSINPN